MSKCRRSMKYIYLLSFNFLYFLKKRMWAQNISMLFACLCLYSCPCGTFLISWANKPVFTKNILPTLALKVILGHPFHFSQSAIKTKWTRSHICGVEANLAALNLQRRKFVFVIKLFRTNDFQGSRTIHKKEVNVCRTWYYIHRLRSYSVNPPLRLQQ